MRTPLTVFWRDVPPVLAVPLKGRSGRLLSLLGPGLLAGARLYCLDGGNAFDPAPLASWLRAGRADVAQVLGERVFVSRSFTCHQLATAVEELLPPLARQPYPVLAALLNVDHMFLDEDLPFFERRHLFERILKAIVAARQAGLPCLITYAAGPPTCWSQRIAQTAQILPEAEGLPPALEEWNHGTHTADLQPCA